MKQFFLKTFTIGFFSRISETAKKLSVAEKLLSGIAAVLIIISGVGLLFEVNKVLSIEVPQRGGSLTEGVVGIPRFINPLLAISDSDRDMTTLVYAGLMTVSPDGELVPSLAKTLEISNGGLTYSVTLKDNLIFHDGTPLTAADVAFTVDMAQDPVLKSPKRADWEGVFAEVISDSEIVFSLAQPYSPFLENLALGILPKHIWQNVSPEQFIFSQFNELAVGAGPYEIVSTERDSGKVPTAYHLEAFKDYALGESFITNLTIRLYGDEESMLSAYLRGAVDSVASISPEEANAVSDRSSTLHTSTLPRTFALFLNQNQASIFTDKSVRRALDIATDREAIVSEVLRGFGEAISGPIPTLSVASNSDITIERQVAMSLLDDAGWVLTEEGSIREKDGEQLSFAISTSDNHELRRVAEMLQSGWAEVGVNVDLRIFESNDLNQNVIRPRDYEALLFGEIVGRNLDLYPFWHSSQRNDPGLNIALYANIDADKLLEEARAIADSELRALAHERFATEIANDVPAIFLYSPRFIYVMPEHIGNVSTDHIATPNERFSFIHSWYALTSRVWPAFIN